MGLRSPTTSHADKFVSVFGPIMKSFGVEVRGLQPCRNVDISNVSCRAAESRLQPTRRGNPSP